MSKRTEKYIQQNTSITQQESIQRILADKSLQNRERLKQLEVRIRNLLATARYFVGGDAIENASTDAFTRILRGFQELVKRTYPNLKMLHGASYSESDIENHLREATATLYGSDPAMMNEAQQEILSFIQANQRNGVRTTLKTLVESFERKPYGWSLAAVQCNLASLSAHSKVEMRADGNLLEDTGLVRALRNTQAHANVVVEPQVEFSAAPGASLEGILRRLF